MRKEKSKLNLWKVANTAHEKELSLLSAAEATAGKESELGTSWP